MRVVGSVARSATEFLVLWLISALALVLTDLVLPGVRLDAVPGGGWFATVPAALALALVFGILSVILWPLLVRAMLWAGPALLFIGAFAGNWLIMMLAVRLVPLATVDRARDLLALSVVLSLVGSAVAGAMAARRDDTYRMMLVRRNRSRLRRTGQSVRVDTEGPGLLCIQIDGLGHGVLQRAIRDGIVPVLADLVRDRSHLLVPWHTDWSSQTGASQLGILHGDNHNVPAFRWYDKSRDAVAVFSNPADNAARETERAHRDGLLSGGRGASRGNLFTGGAEDNVLVVSRMRGARMGGGAAGYAHYFADPASALRTSIRLVAEVLREIRQAYGQRRADVTPRIRRGGLYPLVRAFTTVVETDVVVSAVIGDLIAGRGAVYVDLVGYDEVSHHSGVERPETRDVLRKLDAEIGMIVAVAAQARRPYRIVVLSDHGQSQGATFSQRYGEALEDLVLRACGEQPETPPPAQPRPGHHVHAATTGTRGRGAEGLGYAEASLRTTAVDTTAPGEPGKPVVLASGNLGLVSFPRVPGRATLTWIDEHHPGLLPALTGHPGIGFVLVAREDGGSVVLGRDGSVDVATGEVTGRDPLADFGPCTLSRIRRTDSFDNVADLMINGRYWPDTDEVAAFEEQVGSHGGLGGPQTTPFLLYPSDLPAPPQPLHGAEAVHRVLVGWRDLG
ncbi:phage holin family protein [Rhodococcus sp. NPDC003348]